MSALPTALVQHLGESLLRDRRPAYLVIGAGGRLATEGGHLAAYGLSALEPGKPVTDQVPFLRGLGAATDAVSVVPFVQVGDGRYADIHLFRDGDSEWIVLLDVTTEAARQAAIQQVHNERQLQLQRGVGPVCKTGAQEPQLGDLFRSLDVLALQRRRNGSFRVLTTPPWAVRAFPAITTKAAAGLRLIGLSPFLENFEIDAAQHWHAHRSGPLQSGPWQETDETGQETHMEATALWVGRAALLIIERRDPAAADSATMLQKAREVRVDHLRLRRDMELKEILLHCIVHDLSGPAAAILGCLQTLAREDLSPDMKHLVELGVHEGERQLAQIAQILQGFGVEQDDGESSETGLAPNVEACAANVVQAMGPAFATKNVSLYLHSLMKTDRRVVGDKIHLERILFNLLENALRHAPAGSTVVVEVRDEGDQVLVNVDDRGPGVQPEIAATLFRRFARGARQPSGKSGLGLYFCRITVERWRGTIGWKPRPHGGSRFWFRLPHAPSC